MQLSHSLSPCSKELLPIEFALAFSLFRNTICSVFPDCRSELDNYLSTVLDMALHFRGIEAARLHQFNQDTYWGSLDSELYCRVFVPVVLCPVISVELHPIHLLPVYKLSVSALVSQLALLQSLFVCPPPSCPSYYSKI